MKGIGQLDFVPPPVGGFQGQIEAGQTLASAGKLRKLLSLQPHDLLYGSQESFGETLLLGTDGVLHPRGLGHFLVRC